MSFTFISDENNKGTLFDEGSEAEENKEAAKDKSWHVLVIDDEQDVHTVTTLVLKGFNLNDRHLTFHHVYSAKEAFEFLEKRDDIAVALVDVVMETNDAGLRLIERIRGELQNNRIRLILRTGQPGEAPEESVIRDYDIND